MANAASASELRVFETLSSRGLDAGLDQLLELLLVERTRTELDREQARQLRAIRRLATDAPRALLPIAVTLDRAYERLRATDREPEAFQVRALLAQLLELHDASTEDFDEQAVAADLYVLLAASFFERQRDLMGIKYLERAIDLDPTNATALLALSKAEELRGRHEAALSLLEEFQSMGPAGPEATLRLALNRDRAGRAEEAAAQLASLTSSESPSWIRLLAFQELTRIELERQRFGPAGDTVSRALSVFPKDCTLLIAALLVEERGGPSNDATTDSLATCGAEPAQSARMRYASRDRADVEPVRTRLARLATERLAELGAALEKWERDPNP